MDSPNSANCRHCDFKSVYAGIVRRHKEADHKGISYKCDDCNYAAMRYHTQTVHLKVEYQCSQCEYKTKHRGSLKQHIQGQHGDGNNIGFQVINNSRYCDDDIRYHTQTVHLVEHPCSKCEYKNKHRGSLKLHNKNKHACQICFKKVKIWNLKNHWNLCEFKATRKSNLGKHVKHTHGLAKGLDSCDIATPEFEKHLLQTQAKI